MAAKAEAIKTQSRRILEQWVVSCTRGGKVSRNTVAVGIVVLDHLRQQCPVARDDVISQGGEIKGARSGLVPILARYGIANTYLKEATTRQVHQDGQRLFEEFDWGRKLTGLNSEDRDQLLQELIQTLVQYATDWLRRQNLKLDIDRRQAPATWVHTIVESAQQRSNGIVEQHLVGAKLARRFRGIVVPNNPAHAADVQTTREGDFRILNVVYHVTASPSRNVIQKCSTNIRAGLTPILLVPREQENKARALAEDERIDKELTIVSLEDFVSLNIIELATEESKDFFGVLKEIVDTYNQRLQQVETDLSLQITVR